jgi:hypothetical protein
VVQTSCARHPVSNQVGDCLQKVNRGIIKNTRQVILSNQGAEHHIIGDTGAAIVFSHPTAGVRLWHYAQIRPWLTGRKTPP